MKREFQVCLVDRSDAMAEVPVSPAFQQSFSVPWKVVFHRMIVFVVHCYYCLAAALLSELVFPTACGPCLVLLVLLVHASPRARVPPRTIPVVVFHVRTAVDDDHSDPWV